VNVTPEPPIRDLADPNPNEALWRGLLDGTNPVYARNRARLKHIPGSPRCKMCAAPFGRPGSLLMRFQHRQPWAKNPDYCGMCFEVLSRFHGGAELEASFLFVDVRGSTTLAEGMTATAFRQLLNRFYEIAARLLIANDGIIDKFVGDEAVGIFIPATAHEHHARSAIDAARAILAATGHGSPDGPWLPIGAGVATGVAYIGSIGEPPMTSLSALGDIVNVTARLAAAAGAGEVLVNELAARESGLDTAAVEQRTLELKGKTQPTSVYVLAAETAVPA
jgi:adenylate cyclase